MTDEELAAMLEEQRSMTKSLIASYVDTIVDMIDTNNGSWEGKFMTVDQVLEQFEENPIPSALVCAWIFAVTPVNTDDLETEEEKSHYSKFCINLGYRFIEDLAAALVTAHNTRLAEAN